MLSLLCGLAYGAPDETLLSALAAVEARSMLPIVVGVHDDLLLAEINRADIKRDDLQLVVVMLHDDRPGVEVQKAMKRRSMRCGVEITQTDDGKYALSEFGRCDAKKPKAEPPPEPAPAQRLDASPIATFSRAD
jgi:hypothetical protein